VNTVLVVDDMKMFRDAVVAALCRVGFGASGAADGREAADLLFGQDECALPDLIVLDVAMPRLDGLELLRLLRNDPRTNHVRVLLVSAATDRIRLAEATRLGISGSLLKSRFSLGELIAMVRLLTSLPESPAAVG
jgi:CheY-like chemotaxis protein